MVHLIDAEGRELGQALGTRMIQDMLSGHSVSLTLVFSSAFTPSCVFSQWISCWVSGSQFRT